MEFFTLRAKRTDSCTFWIWMHRRILSAVRYQGPLTANPIKLLDCWEKTATTFCIFARIRAKNLEYTDANGKYYSILQAETLANKGETSGVAFSPGNRFMYVSFQTVGIIYEIRRTDNLPFNGQRLDIKYHDDTTNGNPFRLDEREMVGKYFKEILNYLS